jgi:hypothetical protein
MHVHVSMGHVFIQINAAKMARCTFVHGVQWISMNYTFLMEEDILWISPVANKQSCLSSQTRCN